MARPVRFDDQVVIITGAGNGLGRSHAHLFAGLGARVVVNDLGGGAAGAGASSGAADRVVAEIQEAGGEAVANYDSVEFGDKIVATALDTWGRVDVVVNNAGILRDKSFHKMSDEDWELIFRVHVLGAFRVTSAAWPHMREQQYGRVIMTTSAAGIYGNFGQANYSAAKLGLVGFANTLAIEGGRRNIHVNAVAPLAASRLTKGIVPEAMFDALEPELVSPLVAWLCHRDCEETGSTFEVGGGLYSKLRWERAAGTVFRLGRPVSPDDVRAAWGEITGFDDSQHPADITQSMGPVVDNINAGPSRGGNEFIDVDKALGVDLPEFRSEYDVRDASLYALGVGAAADPTDGAGLQLVYEKHAQGFRVLPSFSVASVIGGILSSAAETGSLAPGLNFGLDRLLHGEQTTEMLLPLPPSAKLTHRTRVADIFDKGKGALVVIETRSFDEDGTELVRNTMKAFIRGAGGWGGERGPSGDGNVPPERAPDAVISQATAPDQALLYRLSGDWNPLHVDPDFAKAFGFDRPILHGLCTYGFATRHVIEAFAGGDPRYVKSIHVRFADSVLPGETIVTEMWKESDHRILFRCRVPERDVDVITQAAVDLYEVVPQRPEKVAAPAEEAAPATPGAADAFEVIGDHVAAHPELVGSIDKVFQFTLSEPDGAWTIDLKNGAGAVTAGPADQADCTLALSEADFMAMASGTIDPMKLYMEGRLTITGDLMASQKLSFLKDIDPPKARRGTAKAATPAEPASVDVFLGIGAYVEQNPGLVDEIGKVYVFTLADPESAWTIDLKNAPGGVIEGAGDADCTLALSEADFVAMTKGEADSMKLYMDGRLKITGDLMASQKLSFLQKIEPEALRDEVAKRKAARAGGTTPRPVAVKREAVASRILAALGSRAVEDATLGETLPATVQLEVTDPASSWVIALAEPEPVRQGKADDPAATFRLTDETLAELAGGHEVRDLFQRGRLRVDGDLSLAQSLHILHGLA